MVLDSVWFGRYYPMDSIGWTVSNDIQWMVFDGAGRYSMANTCRLPPLAFETFGPVSRISQFFWDSGIQSVSRSWIRTLPQILYQKEFSRERHDHVHFFKRGGRWRVEPSKVSPQMWDSSDLPNFFCHNHTLSNGNLEPLTYSDCNTGRPSASLAVNSNCDRAQERDLFSSRLRTSEKSQAYWRLQLSFT